MSDDLLRQTAAMGDPAAFDPSIAVPYIQVTEASAAQDDAAEVLETRDAYGRVPVVVRIRRRPPLRVELLVIAGVLVLASIVLPADVLLRLVFVALGAAAAVGAIVTRAFIRVPAGSVGLVMRAGRHSAVLPEGIHRVSPFLVLTHVVTSREIAFDVPVSEVRSSDGIAVTVDLLLTLGIADPARMVYVITANDLDQLVQASTQDAVRTLIRGIDALSALDLGAAEADRLRDTIDAKLEPYGVDVRGAAFTRVTLPAALTSSLEAKRLASVLLAEERETQVLAQQRLADRAALQAREAETRQAAVEQDAAAEAVRLARLEERIAASPNAARYDLETERLRVAQELAANTRAVVSFGSGDVVPDLLLADQAGSAAEGAASAATPAAVAASKPASARGARTRA